MIEKIVSVFMGCLGILWITFFLWHALILWFWREIKKFHILYSILVWSMVIWICGVIVYSNC